MQESYSTKGPGETPQQNRKHKDSLFVDYFSKDRDWKKHFLSLYNVLHGTNLQVETTRAGEPRTKNSTPGVFREHIRLRGKSLRR